MIETIASYGIDLLLAIDAILVYYFFYVGVL